MRTTAQTDLARLSFEAAPVALLLLAERRIAQTNQAFSTLFGWQAAEVSGKSVRLLYPSTADYTKIVQRWRQPLLAGHPHQDERFMRHKSGELIWMRAKGRALSTQNPFALTVWAFEPLAPPAPHPAALTPREREVAQHIVNGRTSKEAAQILGLSPRTVEVHRAAILRKLNAKNTTEMVARLLAESA